MEMNLYPLVYILSILLPIIHLLFKKRKSALEIVNTFLLYQLIFSVGLGSLLGFYGHVFMSDRIADFIGWPPGNPFQKEVGYANLTFGILGLLCIWFRGQFWTATIFGISIWYLADAYEHLKQIQVNQNYNPGNAGFPLYLDIFLPILLLSLLVARSALKYSADMRQPPNEFHHK